MLTGQFMRAIISKYLAYLLHEFHGVEYVKNLKRLMYSYLLVKRKIYIIYLYNKY
jgi:hypothetical protein